ncbi:hypothetical protein BREVNS_1940 [Brevinematales bacterium NS]|nr:DMT family transporter [Brevinematales bacterium]QJR22690.1 hypothetical protein BREVNS_1940 [Brevinematales bacterium NS]
MRYVGEVASLLASVGWAGSALFFEFGSRRIGSRFVNLWRLLWAFLLLLVVNLVFHRSFLRDVGLFDVGFLLLSGFVGFFLGDILLFWSFVVIGSRLSLLIMLANPFVSAVAALFLFGESLTIRQWVAMGGTIFSIAMVLFFHQKEDENQVDEKKKETLLGVLAAIGGMLGQAGGALLAKPVLPHTQFVFEATWFRVIGGVVGFFLLLWLSGQLGEWVKSFQDKKAIAATVGGSFFGPFVGVSLFLTGMTYAPVGVATTLSSLAPVILLGVDMVKGKKIHVMEIPATIMAFGFLGLFFW